MSIRVLQVQDQILGILQRESREEEEFQHTPSVRIVRGVIVFRPDHGPERRHPLREVRRMRERGHVVHRLRRTDLALLDLLDDVGDLWVRSV